MLKKDALLHEGKRTQIVIRIIPAAR
jgi:hypothetical protein